MTGKKLILLGVASVIIAVALSAWALTAGNPPLRTTAILHGVAQRPLTQIPTIDVILPLSGANLVNLAMGRAISSTNFQKQVLALTIACDLSTANLVVFDQSLSNTIAVVTTNLSFDFVHSQLSNTGLGSTNELVRFVARLQVQPSGSSSNALLGGVLTVAGRVHRDPVTGCIAPVPVSLDTDKYDATFYVKDVPKQKDRDLAKYTARAGLACVIGVLDVESAYLTNTVLLPGGNLSIRRSAEIIK